MLKIAVAVGALVLATTPVLAQDWGSFYGKIYGGLTAEEDDLAWGATSYPIDSGSIAGASIGIFTGIEGLSVEVDASIASANYTGYSTSYDATTLMGNVVYALPISGQFGVYGGVGLGAVQLNYNAGSAPDDASGSGLGGQIFAGVSFDLNDNYAILGEVRHQAASPISVTDGGTYGTYDMDYQHTSILAGLKISN